MSADTAEHLRDRLAANLLGLRQRARLTQEEAAEACGVNWRHWQKLEAGEVNVTINTLAKLSDGLGVDVRRLFRQAS